MLEEAARLKKYNDALEQYLRVQTARIEAMAKQYVNETISRAAVEQADAAKDDVIEIITADANETPSEGEEQFGANTEPKSAE